MLKYQWMQVERRKQIAGLALGQIFHWGLTTQKSCRIETWQVGLQRMQKLNYFQTKKGKPHNKPAAIVSKLKKHLWGEVQTIEIFDVKFQFKFKWREAEMQIH